MKILLTGTYCSGKTTLASFLNKVITDSCLITEPVRELGTVFRMDQLGNESVRDYLLIRQLFEEAAAVKKGNIVICDAGIESNLAHNRLLGYGLKNSNIEKFTHQRYDLVFFCDETGIPLINDGFRLTDETFRANLSSEIKKVLQQLDYNWVTVTGDTAMRAKAILDRINKGTNYYAETIH